jgi:hypothetical protein
MNSTFHIKMRTLRPQGLTTVCSVFLSSLLALFSIPVILILAIFVHSLGVRVITLLVLSFFIDLGNRLISSCCRSLNWISALLLSRASTRLCWWDNLQHPSIDM